MNELNTRLLEYLPDPETVKGGIGSMVETLQAEAPVLVSEVLRWNFAISLVGFVCGVLIAIVTVVAFIKSLKPASKASLEPMLMLFIIPCLPSVALICKNIDWLQIWIAPRLFLLEYVSDLMK